MLAASDGWTVIGHSSRLLPDTRTANMQQQHCLFSILAMLGQFSNHNIPFKQEQQRKMSAAFCQGTSMLCWLLSLAYEFDSFCPPHKKLTPASKVN
jgi:hypothetical protein